MNPIVLDRRFQVWRYGVGHSELLLHAHAGAADVEHVNVLFEDVRAVKLRTSYQPLILASAAHAMRDGILAFADIPQRHRFQYLSLTLSARPESGFVLCARVTVLAVNKAEAETPMRAWPDGARVIHALRYNDQVS